MRNPVVKQQDPQCEKMMLFTGPQPQKSSEKVILCNHNENREGKTRAASLKCKLMFLKSVYTI